jgi:HNH endonuclease/AP2 domain
LSTPCYYAIIIAERGGKMKKIPVANTDILLLVDDEDYELVSKHSWSALRSNMNYGSEDITGYITSVRSETSGKQKTVYIHRLIMNCPKGMVVDHINRDPRDNRKENLRICTPQQNGYNRKPQSRIGYKGVSTSKYGFVARISKNHKTIQIGTFATAEEAALAYNQKAIEMFGEFAYLNEIK